MRLTSVKCPGCGDIGLHRIVYGMPGEDFNHDMYIIGGCIMADFDIGCKKCGWAGEHKELQSE